MQSFQAVVLGGGTGQIGRGSLDRILANLGN
jgi:hypothetical protein